MSNIRVRYIIQNVWSSSSAEERDLANEYREVWSDGLFEQQVIKVKLAAGAVDVECPFTNLTEGRLLTIKTTPQDSNLLPGEIRYRQNLIGNEQQRIVPLPDAREGNLQITTAGLTKLFFSNPGTVAMEALVRVAGID